jgi:predicted nucleic acid-binding protein
LILLDTNVLIYASDVRSPQHSASRRVLNAVIDGRVQGAILTQVLVEYAGATTGPSMGTPLTVGQALAQIASFRKQIRTFDAPPGSIDHLVRILGSTGKAGRRTFDAYLAAQALALGITTICTYNAADFLGIQGLTVIAPDDLPLPPEGSTPAPADHH